MTVADPVNGKTLDAPGMIGHRCEIRRRGAGGDGKAEAWGEIGQRAGDGACAADHEFRTRQDRLDKDIIVPLLGHMLRA